MALQAEALLRLQRHDEADSLLSGAGAPRFGVDESTKFFGTFGHAYFLIVRAQVDMAAGRFVHSRPVLPRHRNALPLSKQNVAWLTLEFS
jgi:hypothetical protein